MVIRKTLSGPVSTLAFSAGSNKVVLSLPRARVAASCRSLRGYFRLRKCLHKIMMFWSKSSLCVQIRLILRNWLYGMLSLHLCGCAES